MARAQYPVQMSKPQDIKNMRAVAVLEWTGDEQHPKASRIVPITVFDGQDLQDGGVYLARPQPLALSGETEYELKDNGKTIGLFDINGAGQEQGSWVGFGVWKPLAKPKLCAGSPPRQGRFLGRRRPERPPRPAPQARLRIRFRYKLRLPRQFGFLRQLWLCGSACRS